MSKYRGPGPEDAGENPEYAAHLSRQLKSAVLDHRMRSSLHNSGASIRGTNPPPENEQLKGFMSAREIMGTYQPLDGDRQDSYDPREGEVTNRTRDTNGNPNYRIDAAGGDTAWRQRRFGSNVDDFSHYRGGMGIESDQQLWDRKLNESQMNKQEYADIHSGGMGDHDTPGWEAFANRASAPQPGSFHTGHTGTYEDGQQDLADYVGDRQYAHRMNRDWGSLHGDLWDAHQPGGEGFTSIVHLGSQFGTSGKRQVVGAHHRLAAMNHIDEVMGTEHLLPVAHHENITQARQGVGNYKYT